MNVYYINRYVVEVENDNAKPGDTVNVYIRARNATQYKSCYRLIMFPGDDAKELAQRAFIHYTMGTKPNEKMVINAGIIDESGCRRYTMTLAKLNALYKQFEDFIADCTEQEYKENKAAIMAIYTLMHKHINAETYK